MGWSPPPLHRLCFKYVANLRETIMQSVTLVGIDLGKHSFHLHGQDNSGRAIFKKKVNRKQLFEFFATLQVCTVVMEACAGAHYMGPEACRFRS